MPQTNAKYQSKWLIHQIGKCTADEYGWSIEYRKRGSFRLSVGGGVGLSMLTTAHRITNFAKSLLGPPKNQNQSELLGVPCWPTKPINRIGEFRVLTSMPCDRRQENWLNFEYDRWGIFRFSLGALFSEGGYKTSFSETIGNIKVCFSFASYL